MANTIRASKNTFNGGLVMDLAPDTTPNEVLTSALNATLVTFNGNELSLQNDMGNGRVETARLPEGYIPVGTCEFGDIIYIVSYNPLTNKSLVGCFPSPERNVSSEEVGSTNLTLTSSDFLEMSEGIPTGKLVASSVKKIIYENKLNPGDKFIIYDLNKLITEQTHITDIGNLSHIYGSFPKLLKIHVVAIEDSGKINYLDSTLKWYTNNYFIVPLSGNNVDGKIDIDSYRTKLNSGYSIFLSKVSGKLALLIELEKITGFSCTYNTFTKDDLPILDLLGENIITKKCNVYWNISWDTDDNNINPSYIVLTKSQLTGKKPDQKGKWYSYKKENGKYINNVENTYSGIPIAYPNEDYWYANISLSYDPSATYTYQNFIASGSYEKVLDSQLFVIRNTTVELTKLPYKNVALTNLSIKRNNNDYKSLPVLNGNKGIYYINASSMGYDTNNNPVIYTPDAINGRSIDITNTYFTLNDDIVNNYFHTSVYKAFAEFTIPVKQVFESDNKEFTPDISNIIYNYEITPAMSYGLLLEYAIEGYIDFSKIGTGKIDLTKWKYYNTENNSTLTIGLDAYVEDNMGVAEVVLEFYDNQGFAAGYHITGKESYSGTFTEYLPLNGSSQSFKLNAYNTTDPTTKLPHAGAEINNLEGYTEAVYLNNNNRPVRLYIKDNIAYTDSNCTTLYNGNIIYADDCGTLYSNIVYLVKVIIKYCPYNALGLLDTSDTSKYKTFYRWYWTNTMYNEYYYNTEDFNDLKFNLILDVAALYKTNGNYVYNKYSYESVNNDVIIDSSMVYLLLSANVLVISSKFTTTEGSTPTRVYTYNTELSLDAGLNKTYNTFSLRGGLSSGNATGAFAYVDIDILTNGKQYVENTIETPEVLHAGESTLLESPTIYPTLSEDGTYDKSKYGPQLRGYLGLVINVSGSLTNEIYTTEDSYKNYKNLFNISFKDSATAITNSDDLYITYKNDVENFVNKTKITKALKDIYGTKHLDLNTEIIHFSKYYSVKNTTLGNKLVIEPILRTLQDLDDYGLYLPSTSASDYKPFYVRYLLRYYFYDDGTHTDSHISVEKWQCDDYGQFHGDRIAGWSDKWDNDEDHSQFKNHSFGCAYRDKWSEWLSFCPSGFCLTSLDDPKDTRVYINKDNQKNSNEWDVDYNFRKYYNDFGKVKYYDGGTLKYHPTRLDSGVKNWCAFNDNSSDAAALLNIAFRGDKDDNIHMFNNWFLVRASNGYIRPNAEFYTPSYPSNRYPTASGNLIASILASIYVYSSSGEGAATIKYTSDIVYLADNYTTFTKDVVYKIYVNSSHTNHNDLINISGMAYDNYIEKVKTNSGISDAIYDDIKSNIELNLLSAIKNIPILFKINYSSPDLGSLRFKDDLGGIVTVKKIDGTTEDIAGEVEQDKLYYIKDVMGTTSISLLDSEFIPKYISYGAMTPEGIIANFDNSVQFELKFSEIWKMFNFTDGKLQLATNTAPENRKCYSLVTKEQDHMAIYHLLKSEVLVPYFKFVL